MNRHWLQAAARTPNPPRSIVIVLGWWGAEPQHLGKYAELYHDRNCLTVQGIVDTWAVLWKNHLSIDSFSIDTVKKVNKLLQSYENDKVPVILHTFSNGGTFVTERVERLITKAKQGETKPEHTEELLLFDDHLRGQIFDSAPSYPSLDLMMSAMNLAVPGGKMVHLPLLATFSLGLLLSGETFAKNKWLDYWNHLLDSDFCRRQGYIYSTGDEVVSFKDLDYLVAHRKKLLSADKETDVPMEDLIVRRLEDSPHIQHLRAHPEVYHEFIDACLDRWVPDR